MKIAGMLLSSPWAARAVREGSSAQMLSAMPCTATVRMQGAHIEHREASINHRPYLRMRGGVVNLDFADQENSIASALPYGISDVTFTSKSAQMAEVVYEFDDDQLQHLVRRGYFTEGFDVKSDVVKDQDYLLPMTADVLVLDPLESDGIPHVFVSLHDVDELIVTAEMTGYDLADLTPDLSDAQVHRDGITAEPEGHMTFDTFEDLFAGTEFVRDPEKVAAVEHEREHLEGVQPGADPDEVFARLVETASVDADVALDEDPDEGREETLMERFQRESEELLAQTARARAEAEAASAATHDDEAMIGPDDEKDDITVLPSRPDRGSPARPTPSYRSLLVEQQDRSDREADASDRGRGLGD